VIDSTTMPTCNRFHAKLANNDKITTFMGYRSSITGAWVALKLEGGDLDR